MNQIKFTSDWENSNRDEYSYKISDFSPQSKSQFSLNSEDEFKNKTCSIKVGNRNKCKVRSEPFSSPVIAQHSEVENFPVDNYWNVDEMPIPWSSWESSI